MVKEAADEPLATGDLVLVGCEHDGSLRAFDVATGAERTLGMFIAVLRRDGAGAMSTKRVPGAVVRPPAQDLA